MNITSRPFGRSCTGEDAFLWTLSHPSGLRISLSNWGATLVSVLQPDRNGQAENVILGFNDASGYTPSAGYLGAVCGRFANRIAHGRFTLNGRTFQLPCNDRGNHLHGGSRGFSFILWEAHPYTRDGGQGLLFRHTSPDGEESYPGTLEVEADYFLDSRGLLSMEFRAVTDADTIVNMTSHAYWNLAGPPFGPVTDHILTLRSSRYIPVDSLAIPLGDFHDSSGGPFDFLSGKTIGEHLARTEGGYDHCMVIDGPPGELRVAAHALHPASGRSITLSTNRPGVQFYSGNFLDGRPFGRHSGFCLEPQDFPDAPNRPEFPSVLLRPGERYRHVSTVEFSAR